MKKFSSIMLSIVMVLVLLAGCGGSASSTSASTDATVSEVQTASVEGNVVDATTKFNFEVNASSSGKGGNGSNNSGSNSGTSSAGAAGDVIFDNASYVLIYNPFIYTEGDEVGNSSSSMKSGYLGDQIMTGLNRAGGFDSIDGDDKFVSPAQSEFKDFSFVADGTVNQKAGSLDPVHRKGEKYDFYYGESYYTRELGTFTCEYAGDHCYIWTIDNSISKSDAEKYGKEFDDKIYDKLITTFGTARFTENGGKVNFLFYSMDNYGGFFSPVDCVTNDEKNYYFGSDAYSNTDHALLHINSRCAFDYNLSTMSHELQHQIMFTSSLESEASGTWINEAMSAYAEELIYPGIKEKYAYSLGYYTSERVRSGQSIYDFGVDYTVDEGAYSAVYLYEEYLRSVAGDGVFSKIHSYFRTNTGADVANDTDAIATAMGENLLSKYDAAYSYPGSISRKFSSANEEHVSKVTLDFYLNVIDCSLSDLNLYSDVNGITVEDVKKYFRAQYLFDEVGGTNIEGGGAILVATKNGEFKRPSGSGDDLIYVAYDENFNIIDSSLSASDSASTGATGNTSGKGVTVLSKSFGNNSVFAALVEGVNDSLSDSGYDMTASYVTVSSASDELTQLGKVLDSNNPPKFIFLQYILTSQSDYNKFNEMCAAARDRGVVIFTLADTSVDELDMNWHVNFDYSNMIPGKSVVTAEKDASTYYIGRELANYIVMTMDGTYSSMNLYWNN